MRDKLELGPHVVVCQKWEERELGWGSRPDGFSLHLSIEGLQKYIRDYWDRMPRAVPDEYETPCGTPYPLGVSDDVLAEVEAVGGDKRYYGYESAPGWGGIDGWKPVPVKSDGTLDI